MSSQPRFTARTGGLAIEMWRAQDVPTRDSALQDEIWAHLRHVPALAGRDLTVTVREGTAVLSGTVTSYMDKITAAGLAAGVAGITQVDDAMVVVPAPADRRSDEALLEMATTALEWDSRVAQAGLTAAVLSGSVALTGAVEHADERDAAEEVVARLVGVRGVVNRIVVPARFARPDAVTMARQSVARMLGRKGTRVRVAAQDEATIELRGRVRSLALRRAAEHAVRRVLGDVALENRIAVAR